VTNRNHFRVDAAIGAGLLDESDRPI